MTKSLIPVDPNALRHQMINNALMKAVHTDDVENAQTMVKQLPAPMVGVESLVSAVRMERMEMVTILLPFADATVNNSFALQWASALNNAELVELLYPVSDAKAALAALHDGGWDSTGTAPWAAVEKHMAFVQNRLLDQATAAAGRVAKGRKI